MKKRILLIIVNGILLIALVVCLIVYGIIKNTLRSQQAATAWAGQSGERFSQISAFIPRGTSFDENAIAALRSSVDRALIDASIENVAGRVYYSDAWSAIGEVSIIGTRGSATAQAIGVGGNYFLFHPLFLRDGSYLSPNDLMQDRVVLDEELAWRLFGAVNLEGLEITINEKTYLIAGVVTRDNDFASSRAYTGGAGLFMSYEALRDIMGMSPEITCYEIVMPDPVTGFAINFMSESFPLSDAVIVENSMRYSFSGIVSIIRSLGMRSMRTDSVIYPYWENAARYTEDWLAVLMVISFALAIFPAVSIVIYIVKAIRFLISRGKSIAKSSIDAHDEQKAEKYRREISEQTVIPDVEDIIREVIEERNNENEIEEEQYSASER